MPKTHKLFMCRNSRAGGAGCIHASAKAVFDALVAEAAKRDEDIEVLENTCLGYCSEGPNVKIYNGPVFNKVTVADVPNILDALKKGRRRR